MTEKKEPVKAPAKKEPVKLIYPQLMKVMKDTEAISKDQRNEAQRYKFRGIDDVYNMIHGVLAKHGIITIPTVLSATRENVKSTTGKDMIAAVAKVVYRFVAEDGSYISSVVFGEAFDFGDKAMNKAMSAAHKYCLLQTFCIPTDEPKDSEVDSHEVKHKNGTKEKARADAKEKLKEAPKEKPKAATKSAEKPVTARPQPAAREDFAEPPPKEYADESDFNPEAKPPSRFDTAVKMTVSGVVKNISYGEALQHFQKAKRFLGDEDYYEVLNGDQFEKSDQVPFDKLDEMYKKMLKRYNEKRERQ